MVTDRPDSSRTEPQAQPHYSVVSADQHGVSLRDFLEDRWPDVDRVFLRRLVAEGRVAVNGGEASGRQRLRADDVIGVRSPVPIREMPRHQEVDPVSVAVLHEDRDVVVVDKPAGLPSEPDRAGKDLGARGQLEADRPGQRLRVVHRLATDASGCLLFAKSPEVLSRLSDGLTSGEVRVEYLALVSGAVRTAEADLARALGPDIHRPGRIRVVAADSKGARAARTSVRREEAFRAHSLVRAVPDSFRGHQVRVHLRDFGHPVVADRDYGVAPRLLLSEIKKSYKSRRGVVERPLLERMFLHVERVVWPGLEQEPCEAVAPLPKDLAVVLVKLRAFASRHAR